MFKIKVIVVPNRCLLVTSGKNMEETCCFVGLAKGVCRDDYQTMSGSKRTKNSRRKLARNDISSMG